MNIFYSTGMCSVKYGGMEKMLVMLAGELTAREHRIFIQFEKLPANQDFIDDIAGSGGNIVVIRTKGRFVGAGRDVYGCIRKNDIRIVHANFSPAKELCVLAGRLAGVRKIICHFRSLDTGKPRTGLKLWFVSRFSDINLAVSEAMKRNLIDRGVPSLKTRVLYNGVHVPPVLKDKKGTVELQETERSSQAVMCIAWDDPVKGVDLLLETFSIAARRSRDAELWIAGESCNSAKNKGMAKDLGIEDRVVWLGVRDDIPDLLSGCDVYIQPSRCESFSRTIAEAMAAGKPVVAFKVGGVPEVVADGVTGILAEPGNTFSLSEALTRLLEDHDLQIKMGEKGRERALRMFDLKKEVARVIDLYEEDA